jgi:hypothetical protein
MPQNKPVTEQSLLARYLSGTMKAPSLYDLAEAIKTHEGWFQGSRSARNNNPGNLKYAGQPGTIAKDKGRFAIFDSYQSGWNALVNQLDAAVTGRSEKFSPEHTLYDFFKTYAPSTDKNYPKRYAEQVAKKLGVLPTTKIKTLVRLNPEPITFIGSTGIENK